MRICFLTQTANDISDYYKAFFKDKDLYFITFKTRNDKAIDFAPKSTWSDGRNKLWEQVKSKYDYYVFIDDDLRFFKLKPEISLFPFLSYLLYNVKLLQLQKLYKPAESSSFFLRLEHYLNYYSPEVLSVAKVDDDPNRSLNAWALKKQSFVRRLGYFDAHFTVFSNYAASKILPYDNKISGWWSAQIPVYLYAFHVFGKKAINITDLGVANVYSNSGNYVADYNGYLDCQTMLEEITKATNKDYTTLAGPIMKNSPINHTYGREGILTTNIHPTDTENYQVNYAKTLKGLENFLHSNLMP